MKHFHLAVSLLVISTIFITSCEEDQGPVTSNEMTIVVNSLNQSDISENGVIEKDENISNGSGNPWGEFIKEAEAECGKNPTNFEIISLSVQITDTEGIDVFEDLIEGSGNVYFIGTQGSDTEAIRVNVGSSTTLSGKTENELSNLANSSDLSVLRERLVGGDFHVGFSGTTELTDDDSFSTDITIKFVVKAHCD